MSEPARSATPSSPTAACFASGGSLAWPHRREMYLGVIGVGIAISFVLLPLKGLYVATGASMEEGFMMVFPNLVNDGKVPNVDFLHLYGPGSLYSLALWFRTMGDSLEAQRMFGLGQHLAILSAIYVLARAAGRTAAVGATVGASFLVLTPIGLTALAWHGGIGLGLWGVVFASRYVGVGRARDLAVSGVFMGAALSFRPDLMLPVVAVLLWALRFDGVSSLRRRGLIAIASGAVGLMPMWVHLARAGWGPSIQGMLIDPVFRLRGGRELPAPPTWSHVDGALQAVAESLPPWWGFPALSASHQLFLWFWMVLVLAFAGVVVSIKYYRAAEHRERWSVLVGASLFAACLAPQALQRPDSTHLAWVAMVSWPLWVPITTLLIRSSRRPTSTPHATRRAITAGGSTAAVAATLALAFTMFVICPFYTYRTYLLHTRVAIGNLPTPYVIERGPRHFWVGDPAVSRAMAELIPDLDARAAEGDRLVVGPGDLSKTVYADTYVYWLFEELEPATYYIEMDPGLANADDSSLADDVAGADFVVLTNTWSGWMEPNTSVVSGSPLPNQVIADQFCLVRSYETNLVLLFERCQGGGGLNPADVAGRAPGIGGGGVPSPLIDSDGRPASRRDSSTAESEP